MNLTYRLRNILIALVFAVVAIAITIGYATNTRSQAKDATKDVSVLVATRDIPVGTPGKQLVKGGYVKVESIAASARVPDSVASASAVAGLSVSQQINAGEQVTSRRFSDSVAPGIQAELTGNLRAVQLAGDPEQVLAGTLETGEHVDVVASLSNPESGSTHVTTVIARNLLVLEASGKGGSTKLTSTSGPSDVLLAMTDTQAQAVFHAVKHGDWMLTLRPVTDPTDAAPTVDSTATIVAAARARAGHGTVKP